MGPEMAFIEDGGKRHAIARRLFVETRRYRIIARLRLVCDHRWKDITHFASRNAINYIKSRSEQSLFPVVLGGECHADVCDRQGTASGTMIRTIFPHTSLRPCLWARVRCGAECCKQSGVRGGNQLCLNYRFLMDHVSSCFGCHCCLAVALHSQMRGDGRRALLQLFSTS